MRSFPDVLAIAPFNDVIEAVVHPPGSKSLTNRALVVAALAREGASRLIGPLLADDTAAMRDCLRALGVLIDDADDPWLVLGTGGELETPSGPLDARASGTTARFITAIAALADGPVSIDGTARMRERPISDLTGALSDIGVSITTTDGCLPIKVERGDLHGGRVTVDGRRSSQFVSALLMLGPMLDGGLEIELVDGALVSRPYVTSTIEVMEAFGASVATTAGGFSVAASGYDKSHFSIEADASAAAYPAVAAAICGGTVEIVGIPPTSTQADLAILDVLEAMGCVVTRHESRVMVAGPTATLRAVDTDMTSAPDAVLALAVACLFADGPSRIRGLGTLRHKETDRLTALRTEINRLGAAATIDNDDLVITPGTIKPTRIRTYDDHRMAMAFAIVGLRVRGIEIDDPGCVRKTWPSYFEMLAGLR